MQDQVMQDHVMQDQVMQDQVMQDQVMQDQVMQDQVMQDHVMRHHERTGGTNTLARRDFLKSSIGALAGGTLAPSALAQGSGNSAWFPDFRRLKIETSGTTINLVV